MYPWDDPNISVRTGRPIWEPDPCAPVERPNPTEADLADPEFEAIWQAIRTWDVDGGQRRGYWGANGSDVMIILNALRASRKERTMNTPTQYAAAHKLLEENLKALGISSFTIRDSDMFPGVSGSFAVSASDILVDLKASLQETLKANGSNDAKLEEVLATMEAQNQKIAELTRERDALAVQNKNLNNTMGEVILQLKEMKETLVGIRANAQYFSGRVVDDLMRLENQFKLDNL